MSYRFSERLCFKKYRVIEKAIQHGTYVLCLETHVHTYVQALTCIRTNTYICSCTTHNERSHQSMKVMEEAQCILPSEGNQSENATQLVFTA